MLWKIIDFIKDMKNLPKLKEENASLKKENAELLKKFEKDGRALQLKIKDDTIKHLYLVKNTQRVEIIETNDKYNELKKKYRDLKEGKKKEKRKRLFCKLRLKKVGICND